MFTITIRNGKLEQPETNRAIVCFFDTDTFKVIKEDILPEDLIDTDLYKPFGCCWYKGDLYIANTDKLIRLDSEGNFIDYETLDGFINPHQILITDHIRCFTNTGKDTIQLNSKIIKIKELEETTNDIELDDTHHVNSLCLNNNKIFFCLHNRGTKPSQYFYIDLDTQDVHHICNYGFTSHNCEIEGDLLYTLDTKGGNFACINWKTKELMFEKNLVKREEHFLRGLQLTKNYFIVGASSEIGYAEILFIDRKTNEITSKYYIEGYNRILDIKSNPL